jgi:GAF domain-containing protein
VLDTLVESSSRLCDAYDSIILLRNGDTLNLAAHYGPIPVDFHNWDITRGWVSGRAFLDREPVHITDLVDAEEFPDGRSMALRLGFRTTLSVPLLREEESIGVITIRRSEVKPFTEKQIDLVKTFADQAVIAIENVRLFEEVQARTRDLTESLQQQTATADVLKVISRSTFDLQAVLKTLTESAARLCEADMAAITRQDGTTYYYATTYGYPPELDDYFKSVAHEPGHGSVIGRTILHRKTIHVPDVLADAEYTMAETAQKADLRTALGVPLLREGNPIGVIVVGRHAVQPFTEKQIQLVTTFADQAVIAIENVRLFDEVQKRTQDLTESLQQQTATADVLKVISRSTFDLQTVLDTLVESAARLCGAEMANIWRPRDGAYRLTASYGVTARYKESLENKESLNTIAIEPGRGTTVGRALLERKSVHIHDIQADPDYKLSGLVALGGTRTMLGIPMLREGDPIGVLVLVQSAVRPFTDKQIELATTFADQAVIAIENVRLFEEVQARTRELTQSVEELRALGEVSQAVNSTLDLENVLSTIVAKAVQLSGTEGGAIYVFDEMEREFHLRATYGMDQELINALASQHIGLDEPNVALAFAQSEPTQVPDLRQEASSELNEITLRAGYRARLVAPLTRGEDVVGILVVRRRTAGQFEKGTVDLIKTFAAQSALAIQNARLFENVETRTRELAKSLADLRTAQDRLVQTEKLASLGQLTAGIAHEIKNPLNFVNNFSAISVELIDELREALAGANLDNKLRAQISEIADMLQGNLDKVVQHGKRADSIVKNMLLHSRQGSQEHRPVDINAIVEESLNLAYHGARAEKQGFNITLERSFDPAAGEVDVFPQEITRVLLNLISNGFYAATKRKAEANGANYEPTLAAATKNLGDSVQIRIRDNGTGIPPEVKEKMFNPFFTTKPVGEGTGLGLSISHDIIVKQHGGSIEVDTQPGDFTEFRIVLPRGAATIAKSGERA